MAIPPTEIRILPMSLNSFTHEDCHDIPDLQKKYFLGVLPSKERNGAYRYSGRKLIAEPGAVVLFQCENRIVASATYLDVEPFDLPEKGYKGYLHFEVPSIRTFNPVDLNALKKSWPEIKRLSQSKQRLDPRGYPSFESGLTGICSYRE